MKTRLLTTLSLLAVLLAACAPAVSSTPLAPPPVASVPTITLAPVEDQISQPTAVAGLTQAVDATPFPIATSRGPNLEATDPQTVTMASGNLQLVEFFEFW